MAGEILLTHNGSRAYQHTAPTGAGQVIVGGLGPNGCLRCCGGHCAVDVRLAGLLQIFRPEFPEYDPFDPPYGQIQTPNGPLSIDPGDRWFSNPYLDDFTFWKVVAGTVACNVTLHKSWTPSRSRLTSPPDPTQCVVQYQYGEFFQYCNVWYTGVQPVLVRVKLVGEGAAYSSDSDWCKFRGWFTPSLFGDVAYIRVPGVASTPPQSCALRAMTPWRGNPAEDIYVFDPEGDEGPHVIGFLECGKLLTSVHFLGGYCECALSVEGI